MTDWLSAPDGAIFTLRRDAFDGAREQWAVIPAASGVDLLHVHLDGGRDGWRRLDGKFSDLADVLRQVPELRTLHAGVLSEYSTAAGHVGLDEFELAALLDLCPSEGDEDPEDWPAEIFQDHPYTLGDIGVGGYNRGIIRRMATLASHAVVGIDGVPVMIAGGYVNWSRPLASVSFFGDSFPAWSGGFSIGLVAPGLACAVPTGEMGGESPGEADSHYEIVAMPLDEAKLGAALAGWASSAASWSEYDFGPEFGIDFDVCMAVCYEPLDPDGTLIAEERADWEDFLGTFPTAGVTFEEEGLKDQYRAVMAQDDMYGAVKGRLLTRRDRSAAPCAPRAGRRSTTAPGWLMCRQKPTADARGEDREAFEAPDRPADAGNTGLRARLPR
jgi:hypothetical protein